MKKLISLLLLVTLYVSSFAQPATSNYILPYRTQSNWLRVQNLPIGTASDSLLVVSSTYRWMGRISIADYGFITQSGADARYLQSFTESDPSVSSWIKAITTSNISNWNNAFAWGDHSLAGYIKTETDPTVTPYVKGINASYFANGNTAFSWGNHAGLYRPVGYVPSWADVTGKPSTFAPSTHTHTQNQITGLLVRLDSIITAINGRLIAESDPVWLSQKSQYSTKAIADGLYKPIGYSPDLSSYSTKAQSDLLYRASGNVPFSEISGKPTTLSGYGILDAFGLNSVLTGYTAGTNTPITASNSLLVALQNLQAQITATPGMVVNNAAVGLSKATLNSTYPNTPVGYRVMCPSITLGGAIYVRTTLGASGTWQLISAPPVL